MFCKRCNNKVSERYNYCVHCGINIEDRNYIPENIKFTETKENRKKGNKNKVFITVLSILVLFTLGSIALFYNKEIKSDECSDFIEYNLSHYLKLVVVLESGGLSYIEIDDQSKFDEYIDDLIKHIDEYKYSEDIELKNDLNISPSELDDMINLNKEYKYQLEAIKSQLIKYKNFISNLKTQYNNKFIYDDLTDSQKDEIYDISEYISGCQYNIQESMNSIEFDENKKEEYKSIYYNLSRRCFAYKALFMNEIGNYYEDENGNKYANKYYTAFIDLLELDYDMDNVYNIKNGDLLDNILYLISDFDYDEDNIAYKSYTIYLDEEKSSIIVEKITEDGVSIVLNYQGWSPHATKEDKNEIVNFVNETIKSKIE